MIGLVLAGGRGERMGGPKALLEIGGRTLVERVVSALRAECSEIVIAVSPGQDFTPPPGCRLVEDAEPGLGPLGGLASAMAATEAEWFLTAACDLPFIRPETLRLIAERARDADAVVPLAGGRRQPLLAAYARTCLDPAREALAGGQRAMWALLKRVRVRWIEEDDLLQVDPDLISFVNVNTNADHEAALRRGAEQQPAGVGAPTPGAAQRGRVTAVCTSQAKGEKKRPIEVGTLQADYGLVGDAHAGTGRQVSLLAEESIATIRRLGLQVSPGDFAENLTVEGLVLHTLPVGTWLRLGGGAELEITQIGKECHDRCAIYEQVGTCVMPTEGVFARVITGGNVRAGDPIEVVDGG